MLVTYEADIQYLGETGYAFQRQYELNFKKFPHLPLRYLEKPTAKFNFFVRKTTPTTILGERSVKYNFLCGKTLKVSEDSVGCLVCAPVRSKFMV